nr:sugar transferase [Massilistercora timonensis]
MSKRLGFFSHFIYRKYVKRVLDFIMAIITLCILSPFMLLIAGLIKIKLGSPVIFKQERPGKGGVIFCLYKFRTMTEAKDENGLLLPDEKRLTKLGKFLRSTSVDELPELWNIVKGEMSFIGPRPLLVQYLPLYNDFQMKRHNVLPGLTGLAQINGRNGISWDEKFKWDVAYVEKQSFLLDVQIALKTILTVLTRDGISSETSETMEDFEGNDL